MDIIGVSPNTHNMVSGSVSKIVEAMDRRTAAIERLAGSFERIAKTLEKSQDHLGAIKITNL